ncbi:MAG: hypothetical protein ACI8XM_002303 [Haloarculaceae archaeon]|jgi:hypothetical protein
MGRTNPTYRDTLRYLEEDWSDFRRPLRERDTVLFDRLFGYARDYADAGGYQNHPDAEIAMLFSICLAQERELAALREHIDDADDTDPAEMEVGDAV